MSDNDACYVNNNDDPSDVIEIGLSLAGVQGAIETLIERLPDITLRDLSAAFCAAGLEANPAADYGLAHGAEYAYDMADALMAEREKRK